MTERKGNTSVEGMEEGGSETQTVDSCQTPGGRARGAVSV